MEKSVLRARFGVSSFISREELGDREEAPGQTMERGFCRFNKQKETAAFSMTEIPPAGFCLSAFLLIHEQGWAAQSGSDGEAQPGGGTDIHRGARSLQDPRAPSWLELPSSHLIYKEAPRKQRGGSCSSN
jgi:hypothetical protein